MRCPAGVWPALLPVLHISLPRAGRLRQRPPLSLRRTALPSHLRIASSLEISHRSATYSATDPSRSPRRSYTAISMTPSNPWLAAVSPAERHISSSCRRGSPCRMRLLRWRCEQLRYLISRPSELTTCHQAAVHECRNVAMRCARQHSLRPSHPSLGRRRQGFGGGHSSRTHTRTP